MIKKILIANRGEIAVRIIRACKDMGIKTVAIFSTADKDALHVKYADEAYCIGPPPSTESYLKYANIIQVADFANVNAIHPGAGFLAEDAQFAEMCQAHEIKFIGPSVTNIETMGDKVQARETIAKAGLKLVPGSRSGKRKNSKKGTVDTADEAAQLAEKIGYPVGIKAVAGGGGRGIRKGRVDVSQLAAEFEGGGHARAAGCRVVMPYFSAINTLVQTAQRYIDQSSTEHGDCQKD